MSYDLASASASAISCCQLFSWYELLTRTRSNWYVAARTGHELRTHRAKAQRSAQRAYFPRATM